MSASPPEMKADAPAKRPRRGALAALWWAFAGAVCAGGFWALTFLALFSLRELATAHNDIVGHTLSAALLLGTLSVVTGLVTGVFVGLLRGGDERGTAAIALGMIGVLTGIIGGGLSAPAVVALGEWLHPLVSSSLAWALAGLIAGLLGYEWSRWMHPPAEPTDESESEAGTAPPRVEWILHQEPRRLRDWPLFRVLPVLVVTAFVLVGAAVLAPSDAALALAAVGVLGLAVALVMQVQEYRLRHLEARLRKLERRFRGAPDEDA